MAGLIEDDTDVEMGRYNEAYQIKTYSGLSPSNMRGASVQYDPVNKTEAVYVDLPSGGKLRIGDRPVTPTQVAETDVAKAADVPVSEDIDTFAKNYKSNPSNIGGKDPSFDDYDMAGYSQAEILQYEKSRTEQYMAQPNIADVVKLTPDQTSQYAAQPDAEMISDYQPPGMFEGAVSETVKGLARGGLVNPSKFLKENFNLYDPLVFQIVDPKTGEFDPQLKIVSREEKTEIDRAIAAGEMPFALDFEQLVQSDAEAGPGAKMIGGLSQFVGAFAGVGKLFKVGSGLVGAASQGAAADFLGFEGNEGRLTDLLLELGVPENRVTDFLRTDPNDPDYVGRFKNALEGGVLGVIADQIAPVYRMIKEGGSKTELGQAIGDLRFQSRQLFSDRLSDVIGAGRAIAQGDTEMLGEVFQRGRPPQSLSAAAPTSGPSAIIRPDNLFRGSGPIKTSLDVATKPYAVRVTGQSQIDDMVQSGLIRPKEGGYGQDGKAILYFGEMDDAVPNSIFTRPKSDGDKNYTIVADSSKIAGREGPIPLDDVQHIWTMRDGQMIDILDEVKLKNQNFDSAQPQASQVSVGKDILELNLKAQPRLAELFKNAEVTADSSAEEIASTLLRAERSGIIDRRTADEILNGMKGQ